LLTTVLSEWVDETGMCTSPFTAQRQIVIAAIASNWLIFPTSPAMPQAPSIGRPDRRKGRLSER
jgi:hypothetical protein